MFVYEIHLILV